MHQRQGKTWEKIEEKERDRGTEGGPPKPIPGMDAQIGNKEKNGKQKMEKERNREQVPNPGPFSRRLRRAGIIR